MGTLTDYVQPEQGSDSVHAFSQGNTSPWIAAPFGIDGAAAAGHSRHAPAKPLDR